MHEDTHTHTHTHSLLLGSADPEREKRDRKGFEGRREGMREREGDKNRVRDRKILSNICSIIEKTLLVLKASGFGQM